VRLRLSRASAAVPPCPPRLASAPRAAIPSSRRRLPSRLPCSRSP